MSWAEVKKINENFGLQYVASYSGATNVNEVTITGIDGVIVAMPNPSPNAAYVKWGSFQLSDKQTSGIMPICRNRSYTLKMLQSIVYVYAWGGGYILTALKNLLQAPLAEGRC